MRSNSILPVLLLALLTVGIVAGQDDDISLRYFQSAAFNAPILEGWEDQSTEDVAQFYLPTAQTTIRTAIVRGGDAIAAAEADLARHLAMQIMPPVYQDKVNLADGTWAVLVYELDDATTASVMARQDNSQVVVVSFVERNPAARTVMLTIAQSDESQDAATAEITVALEALAGTSLNDLEESESLDLPSGHWTAHKSVAVSALGMVFGNDSFIALQEGEIGELAALADAWNRTLLGFFVTPDNSDYLALGLIVVFVIMGTLLFSFVWRSRGIQKDLALIEALEREDG